MAEAKPYSKAQQLARGERRYRRKVASPKQWLIPRDFGGDDVADNIVPLCQHDHDMVTRREPEHVRALLSSLSDAEYAYAVGKAGEDWAERIYGLRYSRV